MTTFLAGAPGDLVEALERRGATIEFSWSEGRRAFARARGPEGAVFARYSDDGTDYARLAHETAIRGVVGDSGALRAPAVLEDGRGWRIEQCVAAGPVVGPAAVDAASAAAVEIPALRLPPGPDPAAGRSAAGRSLLFVDVVRLARAAIGPISVSDLRAARRELATIDLPTVTCHRDYHPKNILIDDGHAWVIDWERAGSGPVGLDLMRLWTSLAEPEDRERVFEHAVELVGQGRRRDVERLRYAVAVAEASGLHTARNPFDRDDATLARLIELIPGLRPAG